MGGNLWGIDPHAAELWHVEQFIVLPHAARPVEDMALRCHLDDQSKDEQQWR
jgi:hypothetical protein